LLDVSPKMSWLQRELNRIQMRQEKVIIFTELRDIQRALQLMVLDHFGLHVTVVNGDTNPSGGKGPSRQALIDSFQRKDGFNVIILSTTAVGFGVNVQAANHVIHFTRCWNPAKEDQATDRAYRIGQKKDVFVYYPTIAARDFESFEQKLDKLLAKKRTLATDMLNGAGDINVLDLAAEDVAR
jgi:ERCC4-related helicase